MTCLTQASENVEKNIEKYLDAHLHSSESTIGLQLPSESFFQQKMQFVAKTDQKLKFLKFKRLTSLHKSSKLNGWSVFSMLIEQP